VIERIVGPALFDRDILAFRKPGLEQMVLLKAMTGQAVKSSSIINMAERTQFQLFVVRLYAFAYSCGSEIP
jgi:hypothetical protein